MKKIISNVRTALASFSCSLWHLLSYPWNQRARHHSRRLLAELHDPFATRRIRLSALLPDPMVVTVGPLKSEAHNTSEYELVCLAALVKTGRAGRIFEIGTFDGRSARAMAMNMTLEGKLYTLNLPPGHDSNAQGVRNVDSQLNTKVASGFRFAGTPEEGRIVQLFGDSATFDFAPYQGQMDLVFIDGSHEFEYVRQDTDSAKRMIKPSGGWLVWHDGPLYGVAPYLTKMMDDGGWPIRLIDGTTLVVGYCVAGKMTALPTNA